MTRSSIRTSRLVLRPYSSEDYDTWRAAYVDRLPAQNEWDRGPSDPLTCTPEKFGAVLNRHDELASSDSVYTYGAFTQDSGTLVGAIDIAVLCRLDRQVGNLGWQIHNRHWGKGYGREATKAGIQLAFRDLQLHRLEAAVNLTNTRSIKLATDVGMIDEGIKKNFLFENSEWVDHHVFAITPEDIGMPALPPHQAIVK